MPTLFGLGGPLIEFALGVALLLGVFTLPAALASVALLCNYWFAGQLIVQYPLMLALSAVVIAFAPKASAYSLTALIEHRCAAGHSRSAFVLAVTARADRRDSWAPGHVNPRPW